MHCWTSSKMEASDWLKFVYYKYLAATTTLFKRNWKKIKALKSHARSYYPWWSVLNPFFPFSDISSNLRLEASSSNNLVNKNSSQSKLKINFKFSVVDHITLQFPKIEDFQWNREDQKSLAAAWFVLVLSTPDPHYRLSPLPGHRGLPCSYKTETIVLG